MYDTEGCFWKKETEYRSYHAWKILGYVELTFCVTTLISNALVILTLSRKNKISPINTIFIHIAIVEILTALVYLPRTWQELIRATLCSIQEHRTRTWEEISFIAYMSALMFRIIGIWMTVMLAVWRYIAVIHPLKERRWCNPEITRKLIISGYICGAVLMIPPLFGAKAGPSQKKLDQKGCIVSGNTTGTSTTIYEFQMPIEDYPTLYAITFAVYGVIIKLLPSVAFVFAIYRLRNRLIEAKKKRKLMSIQQFNTQADHTTKVLLFILALFIAGEVPHAILCTFTAYYGPAFFWRYYYYGMEISNSLTYISKSFNFIIYYIMSHEFRKTFNQLFNRKKLSTNHNQSRLISTLSRFCIVNTKSFAKNLHQTDFYDQGTHSAVQASSNAE